MLNEKQIEFILSFFKENNFPGAVDIARKLITNGSCIVAGKERIWKGGVGNFINIKDAENAIDCLEYTFDVEQFMKSMYFQDAVESNLANLRRELHSLQDTTMSIASLLRT